MPVYNGRKYFEQALESALLATTEADEIVVVEDGSTDGGVEDIVERHAYQGIIRYVSKSNGGVASALNLGLEKSHNSVFSWLSHDDIYLSNRLNSDRDLRKKLPNIVTISDFYLYYEGSDRCIHVDSTRRIGNRQNVKLLGSRFINGNCLTAPVQLLRSLGGFDESLRHTQDYDMWCKLLRVTGLTAIPVATVVSRQHANQDSRREPIDARNEYRQLLQQHLSITDVIDPRNVLEVMKILSNLIVR